MGVSPMPPKARLKSGEKIRKVVPPTSTETIDTVALTKFRGLRYFVTGWNGDKTKVLDLSVRNIGQTSVEDNVFGRMGDLPLSVGAIVSGSDILLNVTNPNAFAINVEVFKFLMGR